MKASERLRLQDEQIQRLLAEVEALKARLALVELKALATVIPMPYPQPVVQPSYDPANPPPWTYTTITWDNSSPSVLGKNFPNAHASPPSVPSPAGRFIQ